MEHLKIDAPYSSISLFPHQLPPPAQTNITLMELNKIVKLREDIRELAAENHDATKLSIEQQSDLVKSSTVEHFATACNPSTRSIQLHSTPKK